MTSDNPIEEREFAFEVDNESMLRKVKKHLLADSLDYVRELVQMSVEANASEINVRYKPWKFTLEDDGEGITREEIEHLLSSLFVPASTQTRYEGLAPAVISALESGAERVTIESNADGQSVLFTIDNELNMLFKESGRKKPGTRITVHRPLSKDIFYKKLKRKENEADKVEKYCTFVPSDLRLNGKLLNPDKTLEDVLVQVELQDGDDTRIVMGFPKEGWGGSEISLLKNGILYAYSSDSYGSGIAVSAVIDSSRFKINLSRNAIVHDEGDEDWTTKLLKAHMSDLSMALCDYILELHDREPDKFYYPPKKGSELSLAKEYLKQAIKKTTTYNQNTKRLNKRRNYYKFSREEITRLRDMPLFPTLQGKAMSLHDIEKILKEKGEIPYTVRRKYYIPFYRRRDESLEDLLVLETNNDAEFLMSLFGDYNMTSSTEILDREKRARTWGRKKPKERVNPEREAFEKELRANSIPWSKVFRSLGEGLTEYLFNPAQKYVLSPLGKAGGVILMGGAVAGGAIIKGGAVAGGAIITGVGILGAVALAPLFFAGKGIAKGIEYISDSMDNSIIRHRTKRSLRKEEEKMKLRKREEKQRHQFYENMTRFLLSPEVMEMLPRFGLKELPLPRIYSLHRHDCRRISKSGPIYLYDINEGEGISIGEKIESKVSPSSKLNTLSHMVEDITETLQMYNDVNERSQLALEDDEEKEMKRLERRLKKHQKGLKERAKTLEKPRKVTAKTKTGKKKRKKKEEARTWLHFEEDNKFTDDLLSREYNPRFSYAFLPVFARQLMRNNYKSRKGIYTLKSDSEILTNMLLMAQLKQMDRLSDEVVDDMLTQYESGDEKNFQKSYTLLGEELRGKVITGIYEIGGSNARLDEYISKVDHELVDEIGTRQIQEGKEN